MRQRRNLLGGQISLARRTLFRFRWSAAGAPFWRIFCAILAHISTATQSLRKGPAAERGQFGHHSVQRIIAQSALA